MVTDNAKPGDVVELKDKEGGFTDPETSFDISRDQKVELTNPVGRRTHEAIVSGGLLVVSGGKKSRNLGEAKEGESDESGDDSDLPEDFPGRDVFVGLGMNRESVAALDHEGLVALKGIGAKTADAVLGYKGE